MKLHPFMIIALLACAALHADIKQVSVKWSPSLCQDSCVKNLQKTFSKLNGVENVTINQPGGQMNLRWKPGARFTTTAVYNTMAMTGLYINEFRIQVTGTISHNDKNVFLTSSNDGTKFVLLSPIQPSQTDYVTKQNVATHQLSPELDQRLLQYEQNQQHVLIDGPIFEAYRSPPEPLRLIAENVREDQSQP